MSEKTKNIILSDNIKRMRLGLLGVIGVNLLVLAILIIPEGFFELDYYEYIRFPLMGICALYYLLTIKSAKAKNPGKFQSVLFYSTLSVGLFLAAFLSAASNMDDVLTFVFIFGIFLSAFVLYIPPLKFFFISFPSAALLSFLIFYQDGINAFFTDNFINTLAAVILSLVIANINFKSKVENINNMYAINEKNRKLEYMVKFDDLTGLYNRKTILNLFEENKCIWEKAKRIIGVMIIDIDFFKKFNDYYGHLEGDKCLEKISKEFLRAIPEKDFYIGRFGGEEFIAVFSTDSKKDIYQAAHTLRKAIYDLDIEHKKSPFEKITISIGVSSEKDEYTSMDSLIYKADTAMYKAKHYGRNKVVYPEFEKAG